MRRISVLLLCSMAWAAPSKDTLTPQKLRGLAPDFSLSDDHGHPLTLSTYKGKVVLLDFWATYCGGCKEEIPWYVEFNHRFEKQGLAVIGISMDDDGMKVVRPFLAQHQMNYPVVVGTGTLAAQYRLREMPMTLLIDRQGRIAVSHTGVVDKSQFESLIHQLLRQ